MNVQFTISGYSMLLTGFLFGLALSAAISWAYSEARVAFDRHVESEVRRRSKK